MYHAWIPNIVGRLSFRLIGDTSHPTQCLYSNTAVGNKRYIIAYQKRQTADHIFPSVLSNFLGINEYFWFVFIGRAPQNDAGADGKLIGKIFLFNDKSDWKKKLKIDGKHTCEKFVKNTQEEFYSYAKNDDSSPTQDSLYKKFTKCYSELENYSLATFKVVLNRNGFVTIFNPEIKDHLVRINSEKYAEKQNYDFYEWLTNSAYFYLRDISHEHQHHHPNQDTILTVHSSKSKSRKWGNRILYALYYSILSNKRSEKNGNLENSLGIIAYAQSFKKICEERGFTCQGFNDEEAIKSIESKIRVRNFENEKYQSWRRHSDSLVIAVLAFMIAVFTLVTAYDKNQAAYDIYAKTLAEYINQNVSTLFIICLSIIILIRVRRWLLSTSFFFDLMRLIHAIKSRSINIFITGLIGLFFSYLTIIQLLKLIQ